MSTATELQTILSTTKFRLLQRHGTAATLDLNSMHAGEIAIATDTHAVYVCFGDGVFGQVSGGIVIKGLYADLATLEAAHATGTEGDFYFVGAASPYNVYGWFDDAWTDCGAWNDASLYATAASVASGYSLTTETFTRASDTTITVAAGATSRWQKGDMIRLVQHSATKYFYVLAVADTLLTVIGQTPSILVEDTSTYPITAINFARAVRPHGFPDYFTWTPSLYGSTTAGSHTYSARVGYFNIIGARMFFELVIVLTAKDAGMAGFVRVDLPRGSAVQSYPAIGYIQQISLPAGKAFFLSTTSSGGYLALQAGVGGGTTINVAAADISDTSDLRMSGSCYI